MQNFNQNQSAKKSSQQIEKQVRVHTLSKFNSNLLATTENHYNRKKLKNFKKPGD